MNAFHVYLRASHELTRKKCATKSCLLNETRCTQYTASVRWDRLNTQCETNKLLFHSESEQQRQRGKGYMNSLQTEKGTTQVTQN